MGGQGGLGLAQQALGLGQESGGGLALVAMQGPDGVGREADDAARVVVAGLAGGELVVEAGAHRLRQGLQVGWHHAS